MRGVPGLRGLSAGTVARQTWRQFQEDDVLTYAGALAFHSILALFPLLVFLVALLGFLDLEELMPRLLAWAGTALPAQGMEQISTVLQETQSGRNTGLLSLGAAGAVWAASGGMRAAMTVLNRAYDVREDRSTWKRYALSIAYTLGIALLIVLAIVLMVVGPGAVEWLAEGIGLDGVVATVWRWLRYPVAAVLLVFATALAYSLLPNVPGFRWLTPGSVVAVLIWIALSLLFQLYLANFGRYNVLYGSLGAVIVLLIYLWLSSAVLLVGGELNAVVERGARERERVQGN